MCPSRGTGDRAITAIKLGAVALADDDPVRREIVDEIVGIADQTVAKLRDLSMLLRPPQLDALGRSGGALAGAGAVPQRAARAGARIVPLSERPPATVELACFRIVQEALTNVLRHADATQVRVCLAPDGDMLNVSVGDDGNGFTLAAAAGLGLVIMRERAQLAGGSFRIVSAPGQGTRVEARLPMRERM